MSVGRAPCSSCLACAWIVLGCSASPAPDGVGSSSTSGATATSTSTAESSSSEASTGVLVDGPPQVLDVGRSALSITEGEDVVLTAFVQHPRGDEAIVSGVIVGPGVPEEYGPFARGEHGRWTIRIAWSQFDARTDLTFDHGIDMPLVARFVDDAGLIGERELALPLHCISLAPNACRGSCTDFEGSSNDCGGCGKHCELQNLMGLELGGCTNGVCGPKWAACVDPQDAIDCDIACAQLGTTCVPNGCQGTTMLAFDDEAYCSDEWAGLVGGTPGDCSATPLTGFMRCCCA